MTEGSDRVRYLEGAVEYLNLLFDGATQGDADLSLDDALHVARSLPFAAEYVEIAAIDRGYRARLKDDARVCVSYDESALGIALVDGRDRKGASSLYLSSGRATASFGRLLSALVQGATPDAITQLAAAESIAVDRLLATMADRSLLVDHELPIATSPLSDHDRPSWREVEGGAARTRLTWLGHASVMIERGSSVVWIDPLFPPRIAWDAEDREQLFAPTFGEVALFDRYEEKPSPLSMQDVPSPDVVLITHQDADHLDLGVLLALPKKTIIVVPRSRPARPWEVDLRALIGRVLGDERRVMVLGHGERFRVGGLDIAAFPFRGEMPVALSHSWNCYLVQTDDAAIAFTADARLDDENLAFLASEMSDTNVPLTLCAGPLRGRRDMPGWREGLTSVQLWSSSRLWGWYAPTYSLFQPTPCANVTIDQLVQLRRTAGLRSYLPYAVGSTPWYRISDPTDPLYLPISSLTRREWEAIASSLAANPAAPDLLEAKYGRAVVVG